MTEPSRWAKRHELKEYIAPPSPANREGRIPVGKIGRKVVAAKDEQSVLVFGPTGSGKTQGVVIPAMLEWTGPVVSTSVKKDVLERTIEKREEQGPIFVFDPSKTTSYETSTWSPLANCKNWEDSLDMAKWLINASPTSQDEGKDRTFWMANAQNLLAPMLYAASKVEGTMGTVADWVDGNNMEEPATIIITLRQRAEGKVKLLDAYSQLKDDVSVSELKNHVIGEFMGFKSQKDQLIESLEQATDEDQKDNLINQLRITDEMMEQSYGGIEITEELEKYGESPNEKSVTTLKKTSEQELQSASMAINKFRSIPNLPDDTRGSAYGVVNSILDVYKYPKVREATASSSIDPEKLLESGGTLYIVAPQYEQDKYQPLFEALIMSMVRTVQNKALTDKPIDKNLLLALDEAGNVAPLKDLGHIASMMRSDKLRLITVFQDWSQLEDRYGKKAGTIVNAHLVKLVLAGLTDLPTLENLSKLLGEAQVPQKSTTKQGNWGKDKGSSTTHSTQFRPLLTPDALRRFPYGNAISIMADRHPTRMKLRLAYKEKDLQNHTSPNNEIVFEPHSAQDKPKM